MAFRHSVVLLMCLTFAAARTVNLEKFVLSLTDDSKDTDADLTDILTSFLADRDNTSDDAEFELQGCSKGSCTFCKKKVVKVCFVASIEGSSINLAVTVNGHDIIHTAIKAPTTICKDLPFIPGVKKICVELSDIDLKKMSGCVAVSVKTMLKTVHFKIGCFTIPHGDVEGETQSTTELGSQAEEGFEQKARGVEESGSEQGTVLKFLSLRTEK